LVVLREVSSLESFRNCQEKCKVGGVDADPRLIRSSSIGFGRALASETAMPFSAEIDAGDAEENGGSGLTSKHGVNGGNRRSDGQECQRVRSDIQTKNVSVSGLTFRHGLNR
jgi:hypothetical protein